MKQCHTSMSINLQVQRGYGGVGGGEGLGHAWQRRKLQGGALSNEFPHQDMQG